MPWRGRFAPASPSGASSAVLVPLVEEQAEWSLLLTARSRRLSEHPGQLSFPGGRIERGDASPEAAALRETREETAIAPAHVRVVGRMPDYTTFRGAVVAPVVGELRGEHLPRAPPASAEVEEILLVSLEALRTAPGVDWAQPARRSFRPHASFTRTGVIHYSGRLVPEPGRERLIHYWRLENGHTLWGITGDLVARFLEACYGWRPPGTPRRVQGQQAVLPDLDDPGPGGT